MESRFAPLIRRRWFRFSLRTLFVVVTVLAIFLGCVAYQLTWIQQRRAFADSSCLNGAYLTFEPDQNPPAPFPLGLFGERGALDVYLERDASQSEIATARRLFPEARVQLDPLVPP